MLSGFPNPEMVRSNTTDWAGGAWLPVGVTVTVTRLVLVLTVAIVEQRIRGSWEATTVSHVVPTAKFAKGNASNRAISLESSVVWYATA